MADSPKLPIYNLGILGVNRVLSPIHKQDGELLQGQNAIVLTAFGQKAIAKRPGMRRLTLSPGTGDVLNAINIPYPPPAEPEGETPPNFPDGGGDVSMACGAYLTSDLSVATNVATIVGLADEQFDYGSMHDNVTLNSRITIPAGGTGIWLLLAQATWDAVPGTDLFWVQILVNGVERAFNVAGGNWNWPAEKCAHGCAVMVPLIPTDYVQMQVRWEGTSATPWKLINGISKTWLQAVLVYVP